MQPKLCTKCRKNVAVIFITKIENGNTLNEGYCLKCARSLGIPQIDAAVKQMGISEDDLELIAGSREDFKKFYCSPWRNAEYETLMNSELLKMTKEGNENALS